MRRRLLVTLIAAAFLAAWAEAQPTNLQATVNSATSVTITWNAVGGATTYEILRESGGSPVQIGGSTSTTFTDSTVSANTTYRYRVRTTGGLNSAPVYAGTFSFTDDPPAGGATKMKTTHISELRTDINAMRVFGGLSAATFTDPTLTTSTQIKGVHITELRSALNAARTALGMATITFTDSSITTGVTPIKAAHVSELRGGAKQPSTTGALLNGPPVFTSTTTPAVAENTTAVMTVLTTDPESNPRTYAIFGGADSSKFSIHPSTGALSFNSAPDFETPADAGANNVYDVIVSASDGQGNLAATAIAVTVTNVVSETPSFTSPSAVSTTEQVEGVFHTVTATNATSFAITGGADQGDLSITSGGGLSFNVAPDFFAPADSDVNNVYVVEVTATGPNGSAMQTLSVTVTQMTCVSLSLGGVYTSTTPVPKTFCLAGNAEYTIVSANVSSASAVNVNLTATGIQPVTGPPSPILALNPFEASLGKNESFETQLRTNERERLRAMPEPPLQPDAITPGVPSVGALMDINVRTDNPCTTSDLRKARVEVVGTHIIIMQEVNNAGTAPVIANGLSTADYQGIANEFDNYIWPAATTAFGAPADIDSNSRVIAFYTSAVNQLTPSGGTLVDGFFFSRDLSAAANCATSNVGEMIYLLMADPTGSINSNVRSVSFVKERTPRTLAHEIEHLINASRRMYVNTPFVTLEEVWLDEGLAHISEELAFFQKSALSSRSNIGVTELGDPNALDAFFRYAEPNFAILREWLVSPHASGLAQSDHDDATRGEAWSFLRYASDRKGGTESAFWQGLVNTQQTGLTNLQTNLGTNPNTWFADFATATYSDDATTGVASQFTHPSWKFRNLYENLDYDPGPACSCAYELATHNPSNGVTDSFTLTAIGSSVYTRVGVANSTRAIIKARTTGNAQLPTDVQLRVFRRE